MQTCSELIERFGGAAKMSPEIDVPANTIRQWAARESIPSWSWASIVEAGRKLSIEGVTLEALAEMAARSRPAKASAA